MHTGLVPGRARVRAGVGAGDEAPQRGARPVQDWADDRGVSCVSFNLADTGEPDSPVETRSVRVAPDGLTVLDQSSCEVGGA